MTGPNAPMVPPTEDSPDTVPTVPAAPDGFEGNGPTVHPISDASEDVTA